MTFEFQGTIAVDLQAQLQWLRYSDQTKSFITGDERAAFSLPVANPMSPQVLLPPAAPKSACSLPIPDTLLDELLKQSWHGFNFLDRAAYALARDAASHPIGDLLRTLVFGPDHGLYVQHPASEAIMGLNSGSMQLVQRTGDAFQLIEKTKTRGRAALAFAAHPTESLIVYGDNYGTFHAHRFEADGFTKASKIAEKERKASQLDFIAGGKQLLIGGMGYLAALAYDGKKFAPLHEASMPVREFTCINDGETIFVNQGLHGIAEYRYDASGFTKLADEKTEQPLQHMVVATDYKHIAVTHSGSPRVSIYAIQ